MSKADHSRYSEGVRKLLERAGISSKPAQDDADSDDASTSDADSDTETVTSTSSSLYRHLKAQEEWEENVRQLQLAFSVLIIPSIGKYLGRKWAYSRECELRQIAGGDEHTTHRMTC